MGSASKVSTLVFFLNGVKTTVENPDPEMTLLTYLRANRLTGTKLGCAEGGCGACTVMISGVDRRTGSIYHISANACLSPLCSLHGVAVTTVEGIGSVSRGLHPVQQRIAASFGSQCGFCTPGIVMSMYTLLRNHPKPTCAQVENAFEGNLCRCTGYRPILDGFKTFTEEYLCGMGDQCCRKRKAGDEDGAAVGSESSEMYDKSALSPYDPSQEPIFPSELQVSDTLDREYLLFESARVAWHRPTSLDQLLELKQAHPQARIVVGNTEVGIEIKFKNQHYPVMVNPQNIPELTSVERDDFGVNFGAATTLAKMEAVLKEEIEKQPAHKTRVYSAITEMLRWFAGHQVRNVACVGGNIATASPISDLNPLFVASHCVLTLASKEGGERKVEMNENFFLGYRKTAIKANEVIVAIHIPYTSEDEYFAGYKQAHRRDDDIAIVNSGMRVKFEPGTVTVKECTLAFGGMAPFTKVASTAWINGRQWSEDLMLPVCERLIDELHLPFGTPGGMEQYRNTLTVSFFFKFFLSVQQQLHRQSPSVIGAVADNMQSAIAVHHRPPSKGIQLFEGNEPTKVVGRPLAHVSAAKQATGEAVYTDDLPPLKDELFFAPVLSTKAHATIEKVDWSEALSMPGVVDKVDASDVPGSNKTGFPLVNDEEVMATAKVETQGQVIGGIIGKTPVEAQRAAKAVRVQYTELPPIITIQDAIRANSFHKPPCSIETGNIVDGFAASQHVHEGEFFMGGQEHFYLETQATVARPIGEDGEIEVFTSSQNPTESQMQIAHALGVPANRVVVRVKRLGGGFGGKETRSTVVSIPVCVAAMKLRCGVRCMLDRDEDMVMCGTRHPFFVKYKVGFHGDGKLVALDVSLYSNAGFSLDLSAAVLERGLFHIDNAYKVPNLRVTGYICKTNTPSNTAFRGFGGPQGMLAMENIMSEMAVKLSMPAETVRELNLYQEGDVTHYNQKIDSWQVDKCWRQVLASSNFHQRQGMVKSFNEQNRWKKRGISALPVKFGIAFTALFLNQAGALVHVYTDGSVLLAHAGTEMGQGLHTKMIQVASEALGIPPENVHISETSTQTVPNTSPTAASASSDLNGMAILNACEILNERLKPYKDANPTGGWRDWVNAAYFDRVSLSTTGFYKTPGIGYDWDKNCGHPFSYFTQGAAVSEVEIDCLTGDHTVLRTDIVMDVGKSLNPAVDVGQIEGAFVQGQGLYTLEEQRYTPAGSLLTRGPGFYKIPGFADIPIEFNVSLLKEAPNPHAVYSSKAIGEPPLFLAASVFFAIKEAVTSARLDQGLDPLFRFDSPATAEWIRMACQDQFTQSLKVEQPPAGAKPWFVRL